jgi:hypothetical protein
MVEIEFNTLSRQCLERHLPYHATFHGSWLNMAEIEFSALSRQCLEHRLPDHAALVQEVAAWTEARNRAHTTVHWRFTTDDARLKLASLYPNFGD